MQARIFERAAGDDRIAEQRSAERTLAQAAKQRPLGCRCFQGHHGMGKHHRPAIAFQQDIAFDHLARRQQADRRAFVGHAYGAPLRQTLHAEALAARNQFGSQRGTVGQPRTHHRRRVDAVDMRDPMCGSGAARHQRAPPADSRAAVTPQNASTSSA